MHYIWYVAGKSGGHLIPALTHAQQWLEKHPHDRIIFLSSTTALDYAIVQQNKSILFKHCTLPLTSFPGKKVWLYPLFLWNMCRTSIKILFYLIRYRPQHIVSMGGLVSVPVCLGGKLFNIPFDQYELNAVPGKAVNFLSRWARTTFVCFKEAQRYFLKSHCLLTSYPLRSFKKKIFHSPPHKKVILILGGSQGSHFINSFMQHYCKNFEKSIINQFFGPSFHPSNSYIIHQTGKEQETILQSFYQHNAIPATVFAFQEDLGPYYAAADLIIARAGAGTLFEIVHFNKKALIIPLETSSTDHQLTNAQAIAHEYPHLFTVVRQKNIAE